VRTFDNFREIWVVDFEFMAGAGERPVPLCLVAHELRSGRRIRQWRDEWDRCPYTVGPDALFVAYFASAELGCHRVLGWPDPANIIDLYVEFANLRNGMGGGRSLLDAALAFRVPDAMSADEKERNRQLILSGGPWSLSEQTAILDYCESDVRLTVDLFRAMQSRIRVDYALIRGLYMAAVAHIEHAGIPIDGPTLAALRTYWGDIKRRLIVRIDEQYGVFEDGTFKQDRFADWLARRAIPWGRLDTGRLDLSDDMFRQMARVYPEVAPLRELRHTLSQLRLSALAVGADNRNRCLLSPFRAKTGRNAPSNSKFVFGPSVWLRQLIRPTPGMALANIDYAQQEFGIAAALSGDAVMVRAYQSGDPYLAFAIQAGAAPSTATKATHGSMRDLYKVVILGTQYGMHSTALAARIGQSESVASDLLRQHREVYRTFWRWSDAAVDFGMLKGFLFTVFDWRYYVGPTTTDRSLRNWPMQSHGAEILRLACVYALRRGVRVIAPVHDSLMIEAPEDDIEDAVRTTQAAMQDAGAAVLGGFMLATDAKVIRHPERYCDPRGQRMWNTVQAILGELQVESDAGEDEHQTVPEPEPVHVYA
jgi:DNA polymerase I